MSPATSRDAKASIGGSCVSSIAGDRSSAQVASEILVCATSLKQTLFVVRLAFQLGHVLGCELIPAFVASVAPAIGGFVRCWCCWRFIQPPSLLLMADFWLVQLPAPRRTRGALWLVIEEFLASAVGCFLELADWKRLRARRRGSCKAPFASACGSCYSWLTTRAPRRGWLHPPVFPQGQIHVGVQAASQRSILQDRVLAWQCFRSCHWACLEAGRETILQVVGFTEAVPLLCLPALGSDSLCPQCDVIVGELPSQIRGCLARAAAVIQCWSGGSSPEACCLQAFGGFQVTCFCACMLSNLWLAASGGKVTATKQSFWGKYAGTSGGNEGVFHRSALPEVCECHLQHLATRRPA